MRTKQTPSQLSKLITHPVRRAILEALDGRIASPSTLAEEMPGVSLGTVSYHVRVLHLGDAIRLVRAKPVRGTLEHFYTATIRLTVCAEPIRRRAA